MTGNGAGPARTEAESRDWALVGRGFWFWTFRVLRTWQDFQIKASVRSLEIPRVHGPMCTLYFCRNEDQSAQNVGVLSVCLMQHSRRLWNQTQLHRRR